MKPQNKIIQQVTAREIVDLLVVKHADDVAFSEVKNGPSQSARHGEMRKLDFWAMLKTWSPRTAIGYEIKVSRADFLGDQKWPEYLNYCNLFYFVAPNGVIKESELPDGVGLMVPTKNLTGLLTKRKAAYRNVEIPENFWRYILMSKVKPNLAEHWRQVMAVKDQNRILGFANSRKISELVHGKFREMETQKHLMKQTEEKFTELRSFLKEIGMDPNCPPCLWTVKRRIKDLSEIVPSDLRYSLDQLMRSLEKFKEELAQHAPA